MAVPCLRAPALARHPYPGPHFVKGERAVLAKRLRAQRHAVFPLVRASAVDDGPAEDGYDVTGSSAWRMRPAAVRANCSAAWSLEAA